MGLMMWLMMRMKRDGATGPAGASPANRTVAPSTGRLSQLQAQLDEVQAHQAAVAAQLARLSAESRQTETDDASRQSGHGALQISQ
jgi:hypothetical protein